MYSQAPQLRGESAHKSIDTKTYSDKKDILQDFEVYSDKYKLFGKIDIFDLKSKKLIERKREIKHIYDGYIFQIYAHYFCLTEMDFDVKYLALYDLIHNKTYPVLLPSKNKIMLEKFEKLVDDIQNYSLQANFTSTQEKCENCIYSNLCDISIC
jgi:CRISPR-associated protein Cas4